MAHCLITDAKQFIIELSMQYRNGSTLQDLFFNPYRLQSCISINVTLYFDYLVFESNVKRMLHLKYGDNANYVLHHIKNYNFD